VAKCASTAISEGEKPSEGYVKFEAAVRKIVTVSKEDIIHRLPKMFQERVADARKKRKKAFRTAARPPELLSIEINYLRAFGLSSILVP
jgi:hypothetical protein